MKAYRNGIVIGVNRRNGRSAMNVHSVETNPKVVTASPSSASMLL